MSSLIVENVPLEQREAATRFLTQGHSGHASHADLIWARDSDQILTVVGLSPPAGRVVDLILPQSDESLPRYAQEQLVQLLIDRLKVIENVYFAQAVIASGNESWTHLILAQRFRPIADVDLLVALPKVTSPEASVDLVVTKDRDLLQNTVIATMIDSADCSLLDDPRSGADLFEEYSVRCNGNRDHWYLVEQGGELIGCVILNLCVSRELPAEIIYFGVLPEFRGRQFGMQILQCVRGIASRQTRLVTAWVDQINHPALQIYRESGFQAVASSKLFVRPCE